MTTAEKSRAEELEAIRRDIDAIDDGILTLLDRRFQASERVRAAKAAGGNGTGLPFRPAREAAIFRKLLARRGSHVPPSILVRLWRVILTGSSRSQSAITIHMARRTAAAMPARLAIRDHFGDLPVEECRDEQQALMQLEAGRSDICIVETGSPWVEAFLQGHASGAHVFGCLPPHAADEPAPKLLLIGFAPPEASGNDHTLIITAGKLPRDFAPHAMWEAKIGSHRLSALPGYLSEHESPLVGLMRSNPGLSLAVAGRYPAPLDFE